MVDKNQDQVNKEINDAVFGDSAKALEVESDKELSILVYGNTGAGTTEGITDIAELSNPDCFNILGSKSEKREAPKDDRPQ